MPFCLFFIYDLNTFIYLAFTQLGLFFTDGLCCSFFCSQLFIEHLDRPFLGGFNRHYRIVALRHANS